jgi:hypothetical protein
MEESNKFSAPTSLNSEVVTSSDEVRAVSMVVAVNGAICEKAERTSWDATGHPALY